ncbi:MAG: protein kinase, partial [Geminicoccaceae bacterium]|nr:protein kinase [Geminicoccaceae bacterium]
AERRDTLSLREMARRVGVAAPRSTADSLIAAYSAALASAYLALARGDTATSLRRFAALPDSLCQLCAAPRVVHARLLASTGRSREAAAILAERPTLLPSAIDVLWALERARLADRLGDRVTARQSYAVVAGAWQDPDADLTPVAVEARTALRRLGR